MADNNSKVFVPGRVAAVVTGAASGIGLASAKQCAAKGMRVVLSDYNAAAVKAAGAQEAGQCFSA